MLEEALDDRFIIPEDIQKMSKEEIKKEIARLEAEAASEKRRILEMEKKGQANNKIHNISTFKRMCFFLLGECEPDCSPPQPSVSA